jgi:hypothetical protein
MLGVASVFLLTPLGRTLGSDVTRALSAPFPGVPFGIVGGAYVLFVLSIVHRRQ